MRITIDTKHDSKEEIRRAIELLRSVIEQSSSGDRFSSSGGYQDIFSNSSPQPTSPQPSSGGMFDMFNSSSQPTNPQPTSAEKPSKPKPAFLGFELYD